MPNQHLPEPLISIITVCFNSAKTIRQTIESVLNQTYTNIEYILVDGNSTDNTMDIIQEYEPQFLEKGIIYRWISEPDNGIYDAMNKGIKMATGEWIGIINSDDYYENDGLEKITETISNNYSVDIVCGGVNLISLDQKFLIKCYPKLKRIKQEMSLPHPGIFIKKELYQEKKYDDSMKIYADWDLIWFHYRSNAKFYILDYSIANFRLGGVSSIVNYKHWYERYLVRRRNRAFLSIAQLTDFFLMIKFYAALLFIPKPLYQYIKEYRRTKYYKKMNDE